MSVSYQLGITENFPCNYLPEQQERLLVATDPRLQDSKHYSWLMSQGFRRSGEQIYKPHCLNCQACQSLRIIVNDFQPTKSQRRLIKKSANLTFKKNNRLKDEYYPLFEQYINTLHKDGAMYPATLAQYKSFLSSQLTAQLFLEVFDDDNLIAVAVTDILDEALSAVYTFYHPSYRKFGLGVVSILNQIKVAQALDKTYLYLGYQINECQKMNYKNRYFPHQILIKNQWQTINK
ncbi:arginyltransferase [Thalassotalea ganghwensis]